ncbi:xanthine dehydrogenase family protein molybdopterin-binding subunit [Tellurirhabdus bombi]|uniref:xanthine dehydrogenase family protein molybdopterin-binding subunit n=1 Tax=Tellurirhabdus bombi TaxID=2907205 RepID=UPI001F1D707F|nr:xanthine dehydrogenase family protein molybdopterin-binding subunit [Tellurirhabdus bombi]
MTATNHIGKPTNRVDGRAKVTGEAKYAAEYNRSNLTYGVVISSPIAKGKITKVDPSQALSVPGVLKVFTHEDRPSPAWFDLKYFDEDAPPGSPFRPLYDNKIKYSGQPIGLVVAETFEVARYASTLVKYEFEEEAHVTNLEEHQEKARKPKTGLASLLKPPPPKPRGDAEKAFAASPFQIEAEYVHHAEHHNPMEMFASTVIWQGDGKLMVYDKTQGAPNSQRYIKNVFSLSDEDVRVLTPYMGGGFGSGLRPQYQLFLAVMASIGLKRSVRVSLTRQQMFTFGHRPATIQRLKLGASADGKLQAVMHEAVAETSQFEDYTEVVVNWSGLLYQCENVKLDYKLVPLDVYTPLDMRAPGAVTGIPVFECAIDDLAYKAGIDPLEFRLINYAEEDQNEKRPFSSKELRECYRQGAEKFGWSKRNPEPRSTREGNYLVGWGVATGTWDANQMFAQASAVLSTEGKLIVNSATVDIGTGTYTIMTQIAAETLGLALEDVTFKLGDTDLPTAPISGGSWTAASVGSAVQEVCNIIGEKLFKLAQKLPGSPFAKAKAADVAFADGKMYLKSNPTVSASIIDVMRNGHVVNVNAKTTALPDVLKQRKYTRATHSAVFVEVKVDADLGTVYVTRVVNAIAGGRILNAKTARSQIVGATVWGISKALEEESIMDHRLGRFMNHNLSEYHVAVNNDIRDIDVIFVEEHDMIVNPLGAKGLGEIGIVAVPAAISNAVFHATGKRINDTPITPDKLL